MTSTDAFSLSTIFVQHDYTALAYFFANPLVTILIALFVIVLAFVIAIRFSMSIKRVRTSVEELNHFIKQQNDWFDGLSFGSQCSKWSALQEQIRAFRLSCFVTKNQSSDDLDANTTQEICTSIPASHFFNSELIDSKLNLRFYNACPALFTGIGILFTFIGLTAGIYLSNSGLSDEASLKQLQTAMTGLLGGASQAFASSIAGILSSLIFTVYLKIKLNSTIKTIDQLVNTLDTHTTLISPERTLYESKEIWSQYQSEMATHFSALIAGIQDALKENQSENNKLLKDSFTELNTTLKEVSGKLQSMSDEQVNSLKGIFGKMMQEFSEGITKQLSTITDGFITSANSINTAVDTLQKVLDTMTETVENTGDIVNKQMDKLGDTLNKTTEQLDSNAQSLTKHVKNAFAEIDNNAQTIAGATKSLADMATVTRDEITASAGVLKSSIDETSKLFNEGIKNAGDQFKETVVSSADELHEKLDENIKKLGNRLFECQEMFEDVLTNIEKTMNAATAGYNSIKEIVDHIDNAGGKIDVPLSKLHDSIVSLEQFTGTINTFPEQLQKMLDTMKSQWDASVLVNSKKYEEFINSVSEVNDLQHKMVERLNQLDKNRDAVTTAFVETLTQLHNQVNGNFEKIDSEMSKALSTLSGVITSLKSAADSHDNIGKNISAFEKAMDTYAKTLSERIALEGESSQKLNASIQAFAKVEEASSQKLNNGLDAFNKLAQKSNEHMTKLDETHDAIKRLEKMAKKVRFFGWP